MWNLFIFLSLIISVAPSWAFQDIPSLKVSREDEDWSVLKDKKVDHPLLKMKYLPLGRQGYLSIGGEIRERIESFSNFLWGAPQPHGDTFYLHRVMLHSDLHFSPKLRAFIQLKSNTVSDKKLPPRAIDKDELDLHQAFIDWKDKKLTLRVGRQEFSYGVGRVISLREGPSVRQSFDAIKVMLERKNIKTDIFSSRQVETNPFMFDDGSDHKRKLHGVYSTLFNQLDLYWLMVERKDAPFHSGVENEIRHSLGVRWFSRKGEALDYDLEGIIQQGSFGSRNINAFAVGSDVGFTFFEHLWKPRLAFKANIFSGDHKRGNNLLNTFHAIAPKGGYFNEAGILGAANMINLNPSISFQPRRDFSFMVGQDFVWRHSREDGLYNVPLDPVYKGINSRQRYVGSQFTLSAQWKISANFSLYSQYLHFNSGSFLKETTPGKDIDFYTMVFAFKF